MTTSIQRGLAALCISLAVSLPAAATTSSVDYTDIYYDAAESGWGLAITQQGDLAFASMYVYGADNTPRWYFTGSGLTLSGSTLSGPLNSTTGPYFGAPYNASLVTSTTVGTMTIAFNGPNNATLTYSVNGVNVSKPIQRLSFRTNNLTGHYLGGLTANGSGCSGVANGPILIFDNLNVTQSGNALTMTVSFNNANGTASTCTFSGTYTPTGRLGTASGNFNCTFGTSPGNTGTFTLSAIDAGIYGFSSSFSGRDQFCTYNGQFGGVRDVQ